MNPNDTTTKTLTPITIAAALVAVLALVLAVVAVARPAPDAQAVPEGYTATAWDCETNHISVAPASDDVDMRSVREVVAAATLAMEGAPVQVRPTTDASAAHVLVENMDHATRTGLISHGPEPVSTDHPFRVQMAQDAETEQMVQGLRRALPDCTASLWPDEG